MENNIENITPEKKKNWFRRHWTSSILLSFAFLFILIGIFPDGETNPSDKETLNGELSLSLQKEIYYRLVELQDSIDYNQEKYIAKESYRLQYEETMDKTFLVVAEFYNISEEKVKEITNKGLLEQWLMPPMP